VNYSTGKYGQGIFFTNPTSGAPTSNVYYTNTPSFSSITGFTFSYWFISTNTSFYFAAIPVSLRGYFYYYIGNDGKLYPNPTTNRGPATNATSLNTWYHITGVFTNGQLVTYLNGALSNTHAISTINVSQVIVGSSEGAYGFIGGVDDLRIYNTALSATQVDAIYRANGIPSRVVQVKSPIQPGYIYEPYNNYTVIGNPDIKIINSSNPDPRIYVDPASSPYTQWTSDPDLLTEWNTMPFKYYILLGTIASFVATDGLRFPVYVPTTTTYSIELFVYNPGGGTDSVWISMDSETATNRGLTANLIPSWRNALTKSLTAGVHTLELYMREPMGIGGIRIIPTGGTAPTLTASRQNFTGPNGLSPSTAATSALYLKTNYPTYGDGVYWINCNGTPTQTYCLMDSKWDGGGWMLIMKAAQGSTFNWNANYWTTPNTLNPGDTTTNVTDAKFEAFNSVPITDVMAVWPASDIGAANVGGSLAVSDGWVWLVKGWYTSAITGLAGFQIDRDAVPADIFQFSGFSTTSPIWSYQSGTRAHVFGSGAHIAGPDTYITRWGFLWNNEVNTTSTQDAFAGIGLNTPVSSGGDFYFWTGTQKKGFNRNIAWLLYGR
jgi:hypothetical protein